MANKVIKYRRFCKFDWQMKKKEDILIYIYVKPWPQKDCCARPWYSTNISGAAQLVTLMLPFRRDCA